MEKKFEEYGVYLFDEIAYDKKIAQDFLSSIAFNRLSALEKLQTILRLFSLIADYNHLDISVSSFDDERPIKDILINILNEHCQGEQLPVVSSTTMVSNEIFSKEVLHFFDHWFSWIDGFPRTDYHFFLKYNILPLLNECHDFNKNVIITQARKSYKSYQDNYIIAFSTPPKQLLLHLHCDIY